MAYRRTARSEEVRAASRAALLGAARRLFAKNGYEATTMQEVVAEAGTSIGNAYFYFGNKERLFAELVELTTRERFAQAVALVEGIPPGPERIGTIMFATLLNALQANRGFTRVLADSDRFVTVVQEMSIAQWLPFLAESFPKLSEAERQRAQTALWGVSRSIVERAVTGKLEGSAVDLAAFAVRWSLQALCVPEQEIKRILQRAKRRVSRSQAEKG